MRRKVSNYKVLANKKEKWLVLGSWAFRYFDQWVVIVLISYYQVSWGTLGRFGREYINFGHMRFGPLK